MNYLIVSCSTYDMAGRAMIQGAINGIAQFDKHAHFCSLEQPAHHNDWIGWYREPEQNEESFQWADCILDIAGLHTNQGNKYEWKRLRMKYDKPYIFMSQSYKTVDPVLFKGTKVVARGQRTAAFLRQNGIECDATAPDLSFLVEPFVDGREIFEIPAPNYHEIGDSRLNEEDRVIIDLRKFRARRVFCTHIIKEIAPMYELCDFETDIQLVEKYPQEDMVWEPPLPLMSFYGTPEQHFAIVAQAEEVHTARYQIACAAILAGKKPIIYSTGDPQYDTKYLDLMDLYGKSVAELRSDALISCQIAAKAAMGE